MKKTLIVLLGSTLLAAGPALAHGRTAHNTMANKMFHEIDTDNDNIISRDEFDAYNDKKFKEMDSNGDGSISRAEFMAYKREKHARMHSSMNRNSNNEQTPTSEDTKSNSGNTDNNQ